MTALAEGRRGPITAALMLATFMNALDTTVVNVSLPHMQGSLSASPEQITWVLTSYIVASAVATPISGWLAARVGIKTMLLVCISLFTATSVLCGLANSLPEMVVFRLLQGLTGAPIPPLAQAVMLTIYPPERFGRAMALFTMAAVVAPIFGPVVGGYITEELSWRWCFYINVPAGAGAFLLLWIFLPRETTQPRRFDFLGFGSLALGIVGLQLLLDRGPSQDWFNSYEIWIEAIVAVCGLWVYVAHTLTAAHPLFDRGLFRNRNFVAATLISFFSTMLLYSSVALAPLMFQGLLGYSVIMSGLVSAPRGIVIMAVLQIMGRLDRMVDRRLLLAAGMAFLAIGFWEMARFDLSMAPETIISAMAWQGLGQGTISVPLTTLALATLGPHLRADASAINNLIRNLGGSVGIAAMSALTAFNAQRMHASLAAHVRLDDPVLQAGLPAALSPATAEGALRLNDEITRQAMMVAYLNDFRVMTIAAIVITPMLLLLRHSRTGAKA